MSCVSDKESPECPECQDCDCKGASCSDECCPCPCDNCECEDCDCAIETEDDCSQSYDEEESEEDEEDDEEVDDEHSCVLRGKWIYDGSNTIDNMIEALQREIALLTDLKNDGWELANTVDDDHAFLVKVDVVEETAQDT